MSRYPSIEGYFKFTFTLSNTSTNLICSFVQDVSTDQAEDASLEGTEVKVEEDAFAAFAATAGAAVAAGAADDTLGKLTKVDIEHQVKMELFWLQINKHFLQAVELEATQSIDLEPMETDKNTKVSCD